jgi:hypothetical protein
VKLRHVERPGTLTGAKGKIILTNEDLHLVSV